MGNKNLKLKEWLNHTWDIYDEGYTDSFDRKFGKRQASKYYRRVQKKEIKDGLAEYDSERNDEMTNSIVIETPAELRTLDGELVYLRFSDGKDSGYYRVNGDSLIRDAPSGRLCVKTIGSVFNNNVQVLRIR